MWPNPQCSELIPLPISTCEILKPRRMILKKIIRKLDPNKNHDIISICMLKLPGDAIIEPLFTIFKNRLKCGIFPDYWKKGNTASIFKKSDKQNIKNYHPVSLLPVFSKVFGRIIYDIILK